MVIIIAYPVADITIFFLVGLGYDTVSLLFRQYLAFTVKYMRKRSQVKIHLRNKLVRIANFAWICARNYEGTE